MHGSCEKTQGWHTHRQHVSVLLWPQQDASCAASAGMRNYQGFHSVAMAQRQSEGLGASVVASHGACVWYRWQLRGIDSQRSSSESGRAAGERMYV